MLDECKREDCGEDEISTCSSPAVTFPYTNEFCAALHLQDDRLRSPSKLIVGQV